MRDLLQSSQFHHAPATQARSSQHCHLFSRKKNHCHHKVKKQKTINTKTAKMLCNVSPTFINSLKTHYLKQSYQIPVSTTFSRTIIPELCQSERQKLQQMLKHDVIETSNMM
ncbi:hypothetical protein PR048_005876 [Dryococelus australis]|uniref:Uncharacterized protein n=1 Tax=Dryococelus australis TaxID=614101 RepID=A0ABQ9I9E8_9NEOP|nr:hypothetical protein PR048_005876 [Dryococelus australis]